MEVKSKVKSEVKAKQEPYPWPLFVRSMLLIVLFLSYGLVDVVKGPTLLDLKDLVNATVPAISFIFMLGSIGSFIGSLAVGLIMDKVLKIRYLILTFILCVLGISNAALPYSPDLPSMYSAAFFGGFGGGAFDTGVQVLLLDIWKGRDSGPYMHSLHFMYGVGAFLAPVVAKPFLTYSEKVDLHSSLELELNLQSFNTTGALLLHHEAAKSRSSHEAEDAVLFPAVGSLNSTQDLYFSLNETEFLNETEAGWETKEPKLGVKVLYPILGAFPMFLSLGLVFYFLLDLVRGRGGLNTATVKEKEKKEEEEGSMLVMRKKLAILLIMMVFFFFYVGLEHAFGTFLLTFCVKCQLGLTQAVGSDITAVFWGAFAATRGLAVPAAIFLRPEIIMFGSFLFCLVGSLLLAILGETYVTLLYVCSAFLGIGMASVYATGLLWLEKHIRITNRIGAAMTISSALGAKVFPVVVGQTVEKYPMSFMYYTLAFSTGCSSLFIVAMIIARTLGPEKGRGDAELEKPPPLHTYSMEFEDVELNTGAKPVQKHRAEAEPVLNLPKDYMRNV